MSNGPEFFQTVMGRAFYEGTMPLIAKSLQRIAAAMEQQNAPEEYPEIDGPYPSLTDANACIAKVMPEAVKAADEGDILTVLMRLREMGPAFDLLTKRGKSPHFDEFQHSEEFALRALAEKLRRALTKGK